MSAYVEKKKKNMKTLEVFIFGKYTFQIAEGQVLNLP